MAIIVNAVILRGRKVLTVKKRKGPYRGMYSFPGGHVENNETKKEALVRELLEETNSEIKVGDHIGKIEDLNNDVNLYYAEVLSAREFVPTSEIEEIKWLDIEEFILNLKKYGVKNWKAVEDVIVGG